MSLDLVNNGRFPAGFHQPPFNAPINSSSPSSSSSSSSSSQLTLQKKKSYQNVKRAPDQGLPSAADLFVPSLPGLPNMMQHPTQPLQMYAGNLPSYPGEGQGGGQGAVGKDANLYFMMIKARRSAGKQRVILWFNGGPGCSSFDGSLMEVGPFRTVSAAKSDSGKVDLTLAQGGWDEFATVVFIDQPPGTGYSYVPTNGYLHDLTEGSAHLIQFLQNFYAIFPELNGVDTYLAGESFAGQYIPYFAKGLLDTDLLPHFRLSGLAIGNGWIDPFVQYPAYAQFAYEKKLIVKDSAASTQLEYELERCKAELDRLKGAKEWPINVGLCGGVMGAVMAPYEVETNGRRTCMNMYDVRLVDDHPACGMNWPPDLTDVYQFLRRPDVVTSLHASKKDTAWVECDGKVSFELHNHNSPASVTLLPEILEKGVPIMMFAGAEDLICNAVGIRGICDNLRWDGLQGMGNSTTEAWSINGTQVGTWRTHRNLSYVELFEASHMVGFDVPLVANDMMSRFMNVDFSLIPGMAGESESKVGKDGRVWWEVGGQRPGGVPLLKSGNSGRDAAYNVGSAFLILFILLSIVGFYFYFRRKKGGYSTPSRRNRKGKGRARGHGSGGSVGLPLDDADDAVERVPLDSMGREDGFHAPLGGGKSANKGKGKERDLYRSDRGSDVERGDENGDEFALGDEEEEERSRR